MFNGESGGTVPTVVRAGLNAKRQEVSCCLTMARGRGGEKPCIWPPTVRKLEIFSSVPEIIYVAQQEKNLLVLRSS